MCNLSEVRFEQGIEKGIEQGIAQGIEKGIEQERLEIVRKNLLKGKSVEDIADFMDVPISYVQEMEKELSVLS